MPDWPQLERTLFKAIIPLVAIAVVFVVARLRRLSMRDDMGLKAPPLGESAVWLPLSARGWAFAGR
jgi:hypothetical protein